MPTVLPSLSLSSAVALDPGVAVEQAIVKLTAATAHQVLPTISIPPSRRLHLFQFT
jgi:hypothetical protein